MDPQLQKIETNYIYVLKKNLTNSIAQNNSKRKQLYE